ncbi:MAG TPA: hypothetical protein DDY31_07990, partial [Lachnospiraceae bacterium]|nr:hypothetical protein [Lachnospiraceae bacterium]
MGFLLHQKVLLRNITQELLYKSVCLYFLFVNWHNSRIFLNNLDKFFFRKGMIFLAFMQVLLYNRDMDTNNYKPIFNDEQLNKMSKENLTEVILLMQKQQSKLEEKISGLQKKQQLLEEKNKELEFINALLSERLSIAQRKRFGSSSEKYTDGYEQMNLFNEAEETAVEDAEEPVMEEICPKPYKR